VGWLDIPTARTFQKIDSGKRYSTIFHTYSYDIPKSIPIIINSNKCNSMDLYHKSKNTQDEKYSRNMELDKSVTEMEKNTVEYVAGKNGINPENALHDSDSSGNKSGICMEYDGIPLLDSDFAEPLTDRGAADVVEDSDCPKTGKRAMVTPTKTKSLHLSEAHIQAVLTGTKTQTRRNPSYYSKQKYLPGDVVALIHGKDPTPNGYATITDVRKQRLGDITDEEAKAEGNYTAEGWPDVWKRFNRGAYDPDKEVYVLELEPKREPEPEHLEEEKRVFGLTLGYYESLGNGQLPTAEALAKDTGWPDDKARMVVGMLEQMGV